MANLVIKNNNQSDVSFTLDRGNYANWRVLNSSGILYIQSDWTSKKDSYYNVLTLNYNSGNATLKGSMTAPSFIGKLTGNADTASKWAAAMKITLSGDLTGSVDIDGSGPITLSAQVVDDSHNHVINNVDGLQTILDGKQALINGGASSITSSDLATNRALVSNSSGKVAVSAVTSTELGYLSGVTSNIQKQLNNKMAANIVSFEMNSTGSLKGYGGFIDFHYHNSDGKPTNASGAVVDSTPDYTSRIIENSAGTIDINGVKMKGGTITGTLNGTSTTAIIKLSASGQTVTYTKGDNSTGTITTQDTKNTAGSTDTSSKIFLIGATSQATNPQTYSHDTAYIDTNGHLYSNSKQVVNLSDSQALTNKTYNGYTLAAACAKGVTDSSSASAIGTSVNVPTERDIYYGLPTINGSHGYTSSTTLFAPTSAGTKGYVLTSNGSGAPSWLSTLPISNGGTGATSAINALANLDARYRWTATVKCATWSRLCYVTCQAGVVGAKYILNIGATRSNVVYNDTFLVTAHHSSNGKIIKLAGNNYSKGYQVRLLADSNGNNYFELYDNCNSATNSTTQTVYCNLIPISTGAITRYTAFTDGTTLPTNFTVKQTMTIDNTDIQANLSGNAATATSATGADKLNTARTINGTSFNGTANITTANWGTARNIYIADSSAANTGAAVSVNGSGNVTLKLPTTIKATLAGNASTATTLATARTINGTSFNGSANITTANWGTSRTITIGSAGKSVNGSTNYSWTLAEILGSSVISAANLPSYVDDVLEVASYSNLPTTGEAGKIYVCLDNNKTYRWSGSTYVHISSPIVIGTTSGTAYDGGSGASLATTVANHTGNEQNPHGVTTSQIGAVAKSGDTMTGNLIQKNVTLNNGVNNVTAIVAYDDGDSYNYGSELVIGANGNTFLGAGESPASLRSSLSGGGSTVTNENYGRTSENLYLTSDNNIYLETNCNTIANRKCVSIDTSAKVTAPGGFVGNVTGNVSGSAATLATSRTLTIGNTGKSFNGSANVSWSLAEIGAVPISGGTMTGQLKTSFNNSIATGSYQAAAHTLENLLEEVRYSSGCMGSVNLTTAYDSIAAGWYNFLYIPHRSGGMNGGTNGDNCNYGTLLLYGMTIGGAGAHWRIQYTSSKIGTVQQVTNTWRGIQNNLTSPSTTDSLSAAMGKSLNESKLSLSGGTMTGNITFASIGDTATSKGIYWSGSTDGASIYYRTDGSDMGRLVLNLTDDTNTRIDFALNGTTKSYIDASGNFSGNAATSTRPTGFSGQKSSWTWGVTTAANGYTQLTDWTHNGGEIAFSEKDGQVFCQLDGFFYQREGGSRCLDTSDLLTATYIKVRSSSYTSSTAGEIWIVA